MTIIEQIKAEIERQIKDPQEHCYGVSSVNKLRELLSFLDTIESETTYDTQQYTPRPSVGIDDVARVQFSSHAKVFDKKRKAVFDWNQFKEVVGIFYGFGKSETLESEKPINQEGLEEEIEKFLNKTGAPYVWCNDDEQKEWCSIIARHFAQWGAEHAKK